MLKGTREAAAPNKVLIAGTGSESAIDTLKLTEYAAELGYDVVLVRTPFYYKKQMQPANILAFYRTVADRSPLPVMIYSVPPFTGYDIPVELVIELADHPNIIGMNGRRKPLNHAGGWDLQICYGLSVGVILDPFAVLD